MQDNSAPISQFDLSAYDYHLPEELIAQEPVNPRDSARLLVIDRKKQTWEHKTFRDLPDYLDQQDWVVANNSRVLKARLLGNRIYQQNGNWLKGGRVEFVMLEELSPRVWEGLFHASAKYLPGLKFEIPTPDGKGLRGTLIRGSGESPTGTVVAEFERDPVESGAGELPLPHYIQRSTGPQDDEQYQTHYAKKLGSAAAPTAGLHFTDHVLHKIREKGARWGELTLHVGLGTFRPVKTQDIREHKMHEERFEVPSDLAQGLTEWKAQGNRVLAVGTTSVRTLESAWKRDEAGKGFLQEGFGRTSIFIRPGEFQFQVVDRLLTNFHLPKSTLLILISTFAGRDLVLAAYEEAVRQRYRFFSYGDAMLIL